MPRSTQEMTKYRSGTSKQAVMALDRFLFWPYALIPFMTLLWCLLALHPVHAKKIVDIDITRAIESALMGDDAVDVNLVDIQTQQGVVTLTGRVNHLLAKERAGKIAENVIGVRAVINRIDVKPRLFSDDKELQIATEDALRLDPATDSYEVAVEVHEGTVTLTGTVDSWQKRWLCETVTKGVPGVIEVNNDINTIYKSDRSDQEIREEIEAMLNNDVRVDDNLIQVKVDSGEVTLSGAVGSLAEKKRATSDAYVAGVRLVDNSDLQVEWWARNKMRRLDDDIVRSDEQIEKAVRDAFNYDPRVFSFNPNVKVKNGKVILSGVVDNLRAKRAAEQDAMNVLGVRRVQSYLKVRPEDIPPDDVLKNRVFVVLLVNPWVDHFNIDINAIDGWVYLSGNAASFFAKMQAERAAEGVKGVTKVINNITYPHDWSWKADQEIREDVNSELFWSPFVDDDQVSVTVSNGVVSLNGNVETLSEHKAAEDNAYEGGARRVINNLTVTHRIYGPYDNSLFNYPYYR